MFRFSAILLTLLMLAPGADAGFFRRSKKKAPPKAKYGITQVERQRIQQRGRKPQGKKAKPVEIRGKSSI